MKDNIRAAVVILAVVTTIIMNGLANALPFNGLTTGEISDSFSVYFVPAGYVFSIWALIYLGLVGYAIFQALPKQRNNARLRSIVPPFLVNTVANISWLLLWHYQLFALSLLAMLTLLGSLIVIYLRLRAGQTSVDLAERWFVRLPFSIYLGWISVATIANFTTILSFYNWGGFGLSEPSWAVILLVVGIVLTGIMTLRQADVAYNLVFVWAYVGIGVAQAATPSVATTAYIGAGIIGLLAVLAFIRGSRTLQPAPA